MLKMGSKQWTIFVINIINFCLSIQNFIATFSANTKYSCSINCLHIHQIILKKWNAPLSAKHCCLITNSTCLQSDCLMGLFLTEFPIHIASTYRRTSTLSNCPSRVNHCTTNRIRVNGWCRLACVARSRSALVFVLVLATQMPAACSRVEHSTTIPYRLKMMYARAGWLDWLCWWDDVFVLHCLLHNQMDAWGGWVFCGRVAEDIYTCSAAATAARAVSAAARVSAFSKRTHILFQSALL